MNQIRKAVGQSLQTRLLIIGVLPLFLITGLLTATHIYNRQTDIKAMLDESGHRIAEHLSRTTDFALFTGNRSLLVSTAQSIEQMPNIRGVAFLDNNREILLASASFPRSDLPLLPAPLNHTPRAHEHFLLFEEPIYTTIVEVEDYPGNEELLVAKEILGWVVVAIDANNAIKQQTDILFTSIGIGAGVLGTAFLMALALARSVITPIQKLTHTVGALEQGDLEARAVPTTKDELSVLAMGINHLAKSVKRSQSNLEQRVGTATSELTRALKDLRNKNAELRDVTREAKLANQSKSDFLARMSHELRTPLTSIQGFVRLLEQSSQNPSDMNYCQIIDRASAQLLTMINDILEFTKLQSSTQVLNNEPYKLFECIEQPIQLLAPTAHEKGVELYLDFALNVPEHLIGDAMLVRQIVANLVGNAIKFTAQGYVSIKVSLESLDKNGGTQNNTLVISVADTGIGVNPNLQEQIFEAFKQADTTIARRFGGTGLGLPIVKSYLDMLGGDIQLTSTEEGGSLFRVSIPLNQQAPASNLANIPGPVLLYDIDDRSRSASRNLLARLTAEIMEVTSFDDMVDALIDEKPVAVVVNWSLNEAKQAQVRALEFIIDTAACPVLVQAPLQIIREQLDLVHEHPTATFIAKPVGFKELETFLIGPKQSNNENEKQEDLRGISALVAEDNEFSRLLLCTLLERAGAQYSEARDGREAIAACQQERYDVLLVDLHMPEITGIEAIRQIRQSDNPNRKTPVIILTADALIDEREELKPLGIERIVNKPFDEHKLLAALFELSGRKSSPSPHMLGSSSSIPKQHYFSEIYHLLENIRLALRNKDAHAMGEFCHQLTGIAAVYRLGDLDKKVQLLHSLVRAEDFDPTAELLDNIHREATRLQEEDTTDPTS